MEVLLLLLLPLVHAMTREEARLVEIGYQVKYNDTWRQMWNKERQQLHSAETFPVPIPPFTCQVVTSPDEPTSVHQLRPADVDVVAAFGDSITAGNGILAENLLEVVINERGHSWSIGGQLPLEELATVPTILMKFNDNLHGHSTDESFPDEPEAGLNVAVMGARARNMPEQAVDMINKMNDDAEIDMQNDWKVVTLFIGGNDLCGYCNDRENRSPEQYAGHIQNALDTLHEQMPRTFVNLVPMFDVTPLRHVSTGVICDLLQMNFCSCAIDDETRDELRDVQLAYYDRIKALVDSGRYDTRNDFTVVLQPNLALNEPPRLPDGEYDKSYFSPDCFHPNWKFHRAMALGLWNTMLTPVGQKPLQTNESFISSIKCPTTENPYLFTRQNSGSFDKNIMPFAYFAGQENKGRSRESPSISLVVVGAVGAILVIALAIGGVLALKKRMHSKKRVESE